MNPSFSKIVAALLTVCLLLTGCGGNTDSTGTAVSTASSSAAQSQSDASADSAAGNAPTTDAFVLSTPDYSGILYDKVPAVLDTIARSIEPVILNGQMYYYTTDDQICRFDLFTGETTVLYKHDTPDIYRIRQLAVTDNGVVYILGEYRSRLVIYQIDNGQRTSPMTYLHGYDIITIACSGNTLFGYYPHDRTVYAQNLATGEVTAQFPVNYKDSETKYNNVLLHQRENCVWWNDRNDTYSAGLQEHYVYALQNAQGNVLTMQQSGRCHATDLVNAYYAPLTGTEILYGPFTTGLNGSDMSQASRYTRPGDFSFDFYPLGDRIYYYSSDWQMWNAIPLAGGEPLYEKPVLIDPGVAAIVEPILGVWHNSEFDFDLVITTESVVFDGGVCRIIGTKEMPAPPAGAMTAVLNAVTETAGGWFNSPAGTEMEFIFERSSSAIECWCRLYNSYGPTDWRPLSFVYVSPA